MTETNFTRRRAVVVAPSCQFEYKVLFYHDFRLLYFAYNNVTYTSHSSKTARATSALTDMPATVVLGAQWGDEGKGKLVDRMAEQATWVARFQGGNNAGHTVVLGEQVLKFHLLPSGITRDECNLVLGDGMVIDPWVLDKELTDWLESTGDNPKGKRLFVSERAHVILPYHRYSGRARQKNWHNWKRNRSNLR